MDAMKDIFGEIRNSCPLDQQLQHIEEQSFPFEQMHSSWRNGHQMKEVGLEMMKHQVPASGFVVERRIFRVRRGPSTSEILLALHTTYTSKFSRHNVFHSQSIGRKRKLS